MSEDEALRRIKDAARGDADGAQCQVCGRDTPRDDLPCVTCGLRAENARLTYDIQALRDTTNQMLAHAEAENARLRAELATIAQRAFGPFATSAEGVKVYKVPSVLIDQARSALGGAT